MSELHQLELNHIPADLAARRADPPEQRADALLAWLEHGATQSYIGEDVSQLEHALQAAHSAASAGAADALILAALFHDLGHVVAVDAPSMDGFGVVGHERIAAELLGAFGCDERVTSPIAGHVAAKRYLCARRRGYLARLSNGSRETLARQGGPMTDAEADAFEKRGDLRAILSVRAWDEAGKIPGAKVPGVAHYRPMLIAHLVGTEAGGAAC